MPCTCTTKSTKGPTFLDRSVWRLLFDSQGKLHCTVGRNGLQPLVEPLGAYGVYKPNTHEWRTIFDGQYDAYITAIDREENGTVWLGTSSNGIILRYDENLDQITAIRKSESFPVQGCLCAIHIHEGKIFATRCCSMIPDGFENSPFLLYIDLPKGKASYKQFDPFILEQTINSLSVPNCILKVNNHLYFSTMEKPNVYIFYLNNPPVGSVPRLFVPEHAAWAQGGVNCLTYNEDDQLIYGVVSGQEGAGTDYSPWLFKFAPEASDYEPIREFSTNHSQSICCKFVLGKGVFIGTNTMVEQIDPETFLYRANLFLYDGTMQSLDAPIIKGVSAEQALTALEFDGVETLYLGTAPNAKVLAMNINSYTIQEIHTFGSN